MECWAGDALVSHETSTDIQHSYHLTMEFVSESFSLPPSSLHVGIVAISLLFLIIQHLASVCAAGIFLHVAK